MELINTTVKIGNEHSLAALKVGSINVRFDTSRMYTIKNVFFVPKMKNNLLSVSELISSGLKVSGEGDMLSVVDRNDILVMRSQKSRRLYPFQCWPIVSKKSSDGKVANNTDHMSQLEK